MSMSSSDAPNGDEGDSPSPRQTPTTEDDGDVLSPAASPAATTTHHQIEQDQDTKVEQQEQLRKPQKPRTAYFIFMSSKRQEVQAQHPGESVGAIAKVMGQMWKDLDPKEKEAYQEQARQEKEQYQIDCKLYAKQKSVAEGSLDATENQNLSDHRNHLNNDNDNENSPSPNEIALSLPMARIRKICRLDPDVKGISKEAVLLVTRAAELFTNKLGEETFRMAQIQKRRKLIAQDVVDVTELKEAFHFLKEDMADFLQDQQEQQQRQQQQYQQNQKKQQGQNEDGVVELMELQVNKRPMSAKAAAAMANTKPLTSFFQKK